MVRPKAGNKGLLSNKNTWRLLFGVVLLMLTICLIKPWFQNDTYYVIKLGEQILDNGIDLSDHWAWSAQLTNTYPHFLLNIIFGVIFRAFGLTGIYTFVLAAGYAFALSLYYMMEKVYDNAVSEKGTSLYPVVGMIVCVVVITVFPTFISARSQVLSYPLWLWEAWFIIRFLNTAHKRYAVGIIVIAWLCALIHATAWYFTFILFIPFFATIYLTRLGKFLSSRESSFGSVLQTDRLILSNDKECKNAKWLWIVMLLSYATGLLTPTLLCYTSIFKASSGATVKYISEHQPLVLADMKYVLVSLLVLIALFVASKAKCRLDLLFLFIGTFVMSASSKRHVGLLVFIGWYAVFYLLFSALQTIPSDFRERISTTVIPVLTTLVLAVWGFTCNNITDFCYYDGAFVCDDAIDYLEENYDVQDLRLFNDYSYGAYMLFRDVPVFIDSRVNEYTKEYDPTLERDVLNDYLSVALLQDDWREVIEYYDFDGYYIPKDSALYEILLQDPDVEPVWENDSMVIFMTER